MTRLITISSILVIIFSFSVGGILYVKDTRKIINDEVYFAIDATQKEDENALSKASNAMLNLMKRRHSVLSLFVRHEELEEIEGKLTVLCEYSNLKAFDEAKICLIEIRFLTEKIYEREILSADNLF